MGKSINEKLDVTVLTKVLGTLSKALHEYEKDTSNDFVRDSCIQRFEYCYNLSTKFIERYLGLIARDPVEIREMSFPNLIRTGYSKGILLNSWDQWINYRKARNTTSHAYDENKATEVMSILNPFYQEADFLLNALLKSDET